MEEVEPSSAAAAEASEWRKERKEREKGFNSPVRTRDARKKRQKEAD